MVERERADLERGRRHRPISRFTPLHRGCCCVVVAAGLVLSIPLGWFFQTSVRSALTRGTSWSWWRWRIALEAEREAMARDWLARPDAHDLTASRVLDDLGDPSWTSDHDPGCEDERIGYVVGLGDDTYERLQLELAIDAEGRVRNIEFISR